MIRKSPRGQSGSGRRDDEAWGGWGADINCVCGLRQVGDGDSV